MSTKTSIKRIALVAVSALGFGLLSVAPSSAGTLTREVDLISMTTATLTVPVGTSASTTFSLSTGANIAATETAGVISSISKPAGSSITVADGDSSTAGNQATVNNTGKAATLTSTTFASPLTTIVSAGTITAATSTLAGTITFTPDVAGTYVYTLQNATAADDTVAGNVFATFTVIATQQNAARNAFINESSTTNDAGAVWSATALSAGTSSTTPGVSYTANGAITGSVATLTVPAATVIALKITGSATWSTGSSGRLSLNGNTVATLSCTIATVTCTLDNYTAPSTAGTYSAVLTMSGANGSYDPANNLESISFTLTVGSTATGYGDFGNTAVTNALIVSKVGVTKVNTSGRVGNAVSFTPNFTVYNPTAGTIDQNTQAARLVYSLALPSGAAGSIVTAAVSGVASTNQTIRPASENITTLDSTDVANPGTVMYFIPATAGVYTVTVFHDANRDGLLSANEASATSSWTINADALPSVTFTKIGTSTSAALATAAQLGQLVKISLRNGTSAWNLASNEVLRVTANSATGKILRSSSFSSAGAASWNALNVTTVDLTASNFNGSGDAWINVGDTSTLGGTFSYSASVVGGTAAGASGSFTITTIAANDATVTTDYLAFLPVVNAATTTTAGYISDPNVGAGTSSTTFAATNADAMYIKQGVANTAAVNVLIGATNLAYISATVTDTYGLWTGVAGGKYSVIATGPSTGATATTSATVSVAIPAASTAALATNLAIGTIELNDATIAGYNVLHTTTITTQTAAQDSIAVNPATLGSAYSIRAATASSNKFTATVLDQYGNAMSGVSITAQVTAGRNLQDVATFGVTDANGQFSYTLADTYTGTLLTSDTLAFVSGGKTGTVTINYATYNPASTVTITGGASADVAPTVTYSYINAGTSGASGTTVKMTATVKDANGATLPAGIPVKWAISGLTGTSAILVDTTTGYDWSTSMTNSNGEAVTYVYAWGTGTVSVTATAGAVTSATAGKINFANAATDARVVSATVKNNIITAKVVDRYGNPVKGVSLSATRNSGVGYFSGSASSSATGETNALGTVDFVMTGGAANVTVATTTLNYGQTSSAAAAVNGTAITATSIGASLSPAGVQSVTVDVASDAPSNIAAQEAANAAADAAAEAIDAANAATDAANLAAEAADAATVAAEEARDAADAATAAVEELATQVATLMAALKAQITTLANTVAKIAKKVKA